VKTNKSRKRSLVTTAMIIAAAVIGLFLISSNGGHADQAAGVDAPSESVATPAATGQLWSDSALPALAKMVGALLVVIVCIYLGVYLLKRTMGGRLHSSRGTNALEIIETAGLGQHKTLSLVRVGEKSVLVGVTEGRMTLLTELDADDTAAILASAPTEVDPDGFGRMLNTAAKSVKKFALKNRRAVLES